MNKKISNFIETLAELKNKNLVQYDSEERISDYLSKYLEDSSQKSVGQYVFYILGAMFSLAGLIFFIAYNWDSFSDVARISLGLIPLLIFGVLGFYYFTSKSPASFWKEVIPLIGTTGVITSIATISQVYSTNGQLEDFLLVVISLTFLLPFIFNSGLAVIAQFALISMYASATWGFRSFSLSDLTVCILMSVLVAYLFYFYQKNKIEKTGVLAIYLSAIFLSVYLMTSLDSNIIPDTHLAIMLLGVVYCIYMLSALKAKRGYGIEKIIAIILILFLSAYSPFMGFLPFYVSIENNFEITALVFLGVLYLYYLYLFVTSLTKKNIPGAYKYLSIFPLLYLSLITMSEMRTVEYHNYRLDFYFEHFVFGVFAVSVGIVFIINGMKRLSSTLLNLGILSIIVFTFVYFFAHEYSILTQSFIFIVVGISFIVLNKILNALKRRSVQ